MMITTEHAWEAWSNPLKQFIRKRVQDDESSEDLLQEVFLKIHTHIDTLREEAKLQSWVYQQGVTVREKAAHLICTLLLSC